MVHSEMNYGSEFQFCMQLEETILSQETLFQFDNVNELFNDENINSNSQYIFDIGNKE